LLVLINLDTFIPMDEDMRRRYKFDRKDYALVRSSNRTTASKPPLVDNERPSAEKTKKNISPKASRKRRFVVIFSVLTVILAAVILFIYKNNQSGLIPHSIASQVNFRLYYPKNLPGGYQIIPSSFKIQSGVMLFNLSGPANITIPLSEQLLPAGLDINNSTGTLNFYTAIGSARIMPLSQSINVCQISAGNTLITMTIDTISNSTAETIAKSFVSL
jgi:hypothetical protein